MDTNYQEKVTAWATDCFGQDVVKDKLERAYRFFEEACELIQSCGVSIEDADIIKDYVFNREVGEISQEVGGVIVTLAVLCTSNELNLMECADKELVRIEGKKDAIRKKHFSKEIRTPLPGTYQ